MVRSTAALAALLILPGFVLAQDAPVDGGEGDDHTVERGESLWNLARRYYENPFEWRRIYEANDGSIEDPHWIYPGQRFTIPGFEGTAVTGVQVNGDTPAGAGDADGAGAGDEVAAAGAGGPYPGPGDPTVFSRPPREDTPTPDDRTAFYGSLQDQERAQRGGVIGGEAPEHLAVSRDVFYSAPWLISDDRAEQTRFPGQIAALSGVREQARAGNTIHPHDEVEIRWSGQDLPGQGELLQLVRVIRSESGLGQVVEPSALARVVERGDSAVIGVVLNAYTRPRTSDRVVRAPAFPLEPGQYAENADDFTAVLRGFARDRVMQQIGEVGFIEAGASDGVRVGDVFAHEVSRGEGWSSDIAVRFQVVRTFEDRSSVRVTSVREPDFPTGVEVRRVGRMP